MDTSPYNSPHRSRSGSPRRHRLPPQHAKSHFLFTLNADFRSLCVSPLGEVWCGGSDGSITVRSLYSGAPRGVLKPLASPNNNLVTQLLAVPPMEIWCGYSDGSLRVFHAETFGLLTEITRHRSAITALAWDGFTCVYSGGVDWKILQWEYTNKACPPRVKKYFSGHTLAIQCLCFLPSGSLCSGSDDGSLRIWNVISSGASSESIELPSSHGPVFALATQTPSDSFTTHLCSGHQDGYVLVWDLVQRKSLFVVSVSSYPIISIVAKGENLWIHSKDGASFSFNIYSQDLVQQKNEEIERFDKKKGRHHPQSCVVLHARDVATCRGSFVWVSGDSDNTNIWYWENEEQHATSAHKSVTSQEVVLWKDKVVSLEVELANVNESFEFLLEERTAEFCAGVDSELKYLRRLAATVDPLCSVVSDESSRRLTVQLFELEERSDKMTASIQNALFRHQLSEFCGDELVSRMNTCYDVVADWKSIMFGLLRRISTQSDVTNFVWKAQFSHAGVVQEECIARNSFLLSVIRVLALNYVDNSEATENRTELTKALSMLQSVRREA
eukprot:PhF_6_TR2225/c0_g1_i1/m.3724